MLELLELIHSWCLSKRTPNSDRVKSVNEN